MTVVSFKFHYLTSAKDNQMKDASVTVLNLKGSEKHRPTLHTEDKDHRLQMKDDLSPLPAIVLMSNQLFRSTRTPRVRSRIMEINK